MKFIINGGKKISGEIPVAGSKNAALPILAATLLTNECCIIDNVPRITDVTALLKIISSLGGEVSWTGEKQVTVCARNVTFQPFDQKLIKSLRSSILLIGPLAVRCPFFELYEPGGCIIGNRPLDAHFHGLRKLGVAIERQNGTYLFTHRGLIGTTIIFPEVSVTATETVVMAAVRAQGTTVIKNAACEPHVQDLVEFLQKCGAEISGNGTNTLTIQGKKKLNGASHTVIPDPIEAGTFLILALATRSSITVSRVRIDHLDVVLEKLQTMGAKFIIHGDSITVEHSGVLKPQKIETRVYPGIPTDLQSPFGVLATQVQGTTLIHETIFEGRLGYIQELIKMGANAVICDPHRVIFTGPTPLYGQEIRSNDLRAGISMIIAGCIANGQTTLYDAQIIDRGYENIEERLRLLNIDIVRID